jgi:hypothetical protein
MPTTLKVYNQTFQLFNELQFKKLLRVKVGFWFSPPSPVGYLWQSLCPWAGRDINIGIISRSYLVEFSICESDNVKNGICTVTYIWLSDVRDQERVMVLVHKPGNPEVDSVVDSEMCNDSPTAHTSPPASRRTTEEDSIKIIYQTNIAGISVSERLFEATMVIRLMHIIQRH